LQTVNETSRVISSLLAMDDLFSEVTRLISQLLNQARVGIGLRTGNYLIFQKIYDGEFQAEPVPTPYRRAIDPEHIFGRVILEGEAASIEAIDTAQLYGLPDESADQSTALVVPLTVGGKSTGLIVVQSKAGFDSRQKGLEILQSLASQVAVAMENTRLLQKTREMTIVQERGRLARDIHDGVAQNLAYLLVQVDRCLTMADGKHKRLEAELEHMGMVLEQNIEELRRHIFDLRPVDLQGQSIFQVMAQVLQEFGEQLSIVTDYQRTGETIVLPSIAEASLYRVFQEALSNIRRHANCTRIEISLTTYPDKSLTLRIRDDGQGFDTDRLKPHSGQRCGLGLVSMKERIQGLGGTLLIDSQPGQGTSIQIDLPDLTGLEVN
jgi:signal transduction histidine kinase